MLNKWCLFLTILIFLQFFILIIISYYRDLSYNSQLIVHFANNLCFMNAQYTIVIYESRWRCFSEKVKKRNYQTKKSKCVKDGFCSLVIHHRFNLSRWSTLYDSQLNQKLINWLKSQKKNENLPFREKGKPATLPIRLTILIICEQRHVVDRHQCSQQMNLRLFHLWSQILKGLN